MPDEDKESSVRVAVRWAYLYVFLNFSILCTTLALDYFDEIEFNSCSAFSVLNIASAVTDLRKRLYFWLAFKAIIETLLTPLWCVKLKSVQLFSTPEWRGTHFLLPPNLPAYKASTTRQSLLRSTTERESSTTLWLKFIDLDVFNPVLCYAERGFNVSSFGDLSSSNIPIPGATLYLSCPPASLGTLRTRVCVCAWYDRCGTTDP